VSESVLVVVLGGISKLMGGDVDSRTTRSDIAIFAKLGHADGAIREIEATTIDHVLALTSTPLKEIMVPWDEVRSFPGDLTVGKLLASDDRLEHQTYLVLDPGTEQPLGKLPRRRVYEQGRVGGAETRVAELVEPLVSFRGSEGINGLGRESFVLVEDESGKPEGIATLGDGLRFLWGDLSSPQS